MCKKKIANNHNLKKHMRVHTGEKRFCCDTCGKAFAEKKYLQKHQAGHERENERKRRIEQDLLSREAGLALDLTSGTEVSEDGLQHYLVCEESDEDNPDAIEANILYLSYDY